MKKNIFGLGVEILMFKAGYEKAIERVASLKEQISRQADVASKASNACFDQMIASIDHLRAGGDLRKGSSSPLKSLLKTMASEEELLKQLQLECIEALERANAELPSFAAHATEMRAKIPTAVRSGRAFFWPTSRAAKPSSCRWRRRRDQRPRSIRKPLSPT